MARLQLLYDGVRDWLQSGRQPGRLEGPTQAGTIRRAHKATPPVQWQKP